MPKTIKNIEEISFAEDDCINQKYDKKYFQNIRFNYLLKKY